MKTIDELVMESELLNTELGKIPEDKLNTLRELTNKYVMCCLDNDVEGMSSKKSRVIRYMSGVSKRYDVNTDYFEHMLDTIESYYTEHTSKIMYS